MMGWAYRTELTRVFMASCLVFLRACCRLCPEDGLDYELWNVAFSTSHLGNPRLFAGDDPAQAQSEIYTTLFPALCTWEENLAGHLQLGTEHDE